MAKKAGRVSINALESTIDKSALEFDIDFKGVTVHIIRSISLQEMLEFVTSVVESCFIEDGTYLPEAQELAFFCNILTRYANFTLPESTEKKYMLIYNTDAIRTVCEHINMDQLDDIRVAIKKKIDYKKSLELSEQRKKVDELTKACSALIEKMGEIFTDLNSEDLLNAMKLMSNREFDEEALVKAYISETKNSGDE